MKIIALLCLFATTAFAQAAATDTLGSVALGQKFTLSVTVLAGTPPVTFQWWKDQKPIAGATGASYVVAAATQADAGTYAVRAVNAAGSADSNNAVVTVVVPIVPPSLPPIAFTKG